MKIQLLAQNRKRSKNMRRFFTARDMALFKLDASIMRSKHKRGEVQAKEGIFSIHPCSCGCEGCAIHSPG